MLYLSLYNNCLVFLFTIFFLLIKASSSCGMINDLSLRLMIENKRTQKKPDNESMFRVY